MNDLCVPILLTMDDEADAFWCFKHLMDRMVLLSLHPTSYRSAVAQMYLDR